MNDRFANFINGFAAATELFRRASERGAFIECVILGANLIDAQLRIGVILAEQIEQKDRAIPDDLIFQADGGRKYFERDIYNKALAKGVISQELYSELNLLYDERNRVVHRYIITEIKTEEVLGIGIRYEKIMHQVRERVFLLEQRQIELGIGMTIEVPDMEPAELRFYLASLARDKHGVDWLSSSIRK